MNQASNTIHRGGGVNKNRIRFSSLFEYKERINSASLLSLKRFKSSYFAFTMAEALLVLAIIGIIAVTVLPSLIYYYEEQAVLAKLKKFYLTFNEAILQAEEEYGDRKIWYSPNSGSTTSYDDTGAVILGSNAIDNWFKKYFSKFITVETTLLSGGDVIYRLNDGSAFMFHTGTTMRNDDIHFFPGGNINKCPYTQANVGVCIFAFNWCPNCTEDDWKYLYNKGVEPYMFHWDGKRETLLSATDYGCNDLTSSWKQYCTKLIQLNGWRLPKDYPYKVRLRS